MARDSDPIRLFQTLSFPGSLLSRKKDSGWVWSRGTQIMDGKKYKKTCLCVFYENKIFSFLHMAKFEQKLILSTPSTRFFIC